VERLLAAWSAEVGVDIVEQAVKFGPKERLESKAGS